MRVYQVSRCYDAPQLENESLQSGIRVLRISSVELYWASGWLVRSCLRVCYHTNVMFSCSSLWKTAGRSPVEKRIEKEREVA